MQESGNKKHLEGGTIKAGVKTEQLPFSPELTPEEELPFVPHSKSQSLFRNTDALQ